MRRLLPLMILLIGLGTLPATAQERKKVAVVLSGGGAKGMAHIGALKVIERAGIPIDIITGTSMGSIVGGLYAIGYDSQRLDSMVHEQDWKFLLSDKAEMHSPYLDNREYQNTYALSKTVTLDNHHITSNVGGLIEGKNLAKLFAKLCAGYQDSLCFDSLPIPFACVATNIIDNTEYDYHSGRLAEAMRTSMSIPGVFTPMRKGDMLLVDGGLRNNFPADIARQMGADIIIGVTVQGPPKTADDLKTGSSVLSQIVDINCKNKYDENLRMTDVPIRVDTRGYSSASFTPEAIDTLISRGEAEAMKHWNDLLTLKKSIGVSDDYRPARPSLHPATLVPDTTVSTSRRSDTNVLQGGIAVRFDTEDMVATQLNGAFKPRQSPFEAALTLRLGKRIMVRLDGDFIPLHYGKVRLSYIFRHNDMNMYYEGKRDINLTYNQHAVQLSLFNFNVKNFTFDLGARFDYYNYHDVLMGKEVSQVIDHLSDEHFFRYYGIIKYNSEDKWNFAKRGAKFEAGYDYYTSDLVKYKGDNGVSDVFAMWRMSFSPTSWLTLRPMLYGRAVFGSSIPNSLRNTVGGDWFGHYIEQQMPFAGVGHVEAIEKSFVAAQLSVQGQLTENNYVILKVSGAQHEDKLKDLLDDGPMMGYQLAYYYNSMFGPLGATLGYSNRTDRPYFFINLGFAF